MRELGSVWVPAHASVFGVCAWRNFYSINIKFIVCKEIAFAFAFVGWQREAFVAALLSKWNFRFYACKLCQIVMDLKLISRGEAASNVGGMLSKILLIEDRGWRELSPGHHFRSANNKMLLINKPQAVAPVQVPAERRWKPQKKNETNLAKFSAIESFPTRLDIWAACQRHEKSAQVWK